MSAATGSNNTGHGHVYPRPDGVRARCGGPAMCVECSGDYVRQNSREAKHPMTDIDAIRKRDDESTVHIFDDGDFRARSPSDKQTLIHDRRQLLLAYDAKCEELATSEREFQATFKEAVRCKEERDAAHREKAAAMGLVEGHALTIAKLEAERDAAVRERDGLRDALKEARPVIERAELLLASFARKPTMAAYKADVLSTGMNLAHSLAAIDSQLAALAPPTEQPTTITMQGGAMSRTEITIELRGQRVDIEFTIQDRDPDVGIMGYGFEEEEIYDAVTGDALDWELTDDEIQKVADKVHQHVSDMPADYDE